MNKIFFLSLILGLIIFSATVTSAEDIGNGKKIIYVPTDSRPVNFIQTVEVAEKLGYEIWLPPEIFLGTGPNTEQLGNPELLWDWLNQNVANADAAVISIDAMLYGSLVGSRKHELPPEEILERAKKFEQLRKENPNLPIYAFGTVMRTPNYNWAEVTTKNIPESDYYGRYGLKIFQYTALKDKEEVQGISAAERKEMERLKSEVPEKAMQDWFGRRAKNYNASKYLVDLTRNGVFQYFLLSGDDSAFFCQTNLECRHLREYGADIGKEKFQVISGADEIGMLMLSRAINNDLHYVPFVSIGYNVGKGGDTVPQFSNEKISESLECAIRAIGGMRVPNPQNADLVLAIHTNPNGKTVGADSKKNNTKPHAGIGSYMKMLKGYLKNDYPVGVVDISTSNGADNALMQRLKKEKLQFKIRAYGGWNTATNTAGFLIGAGVLTNKMTQEDIYSLLLTRYLDDWVYQANIRTQIVNGLIWTIPGEGGAWGLNEKQEGLENLASNLMSEFAAKNIFLPQGYSLKNIQARFPWSRTFESEITFDLVEN